MTRTRYLRARSNLPLLILCGISVLFGHAQSPPTTLIRVPVGNMFSSASPDADVVSQAIYASEVIVLEKQNGFTRVRTPDEYTGWIRDEDVLSRDTDPPNSERAPASFVLVRSISANLYREPDVTRHAPLLTVPFETRLQIIPVETQLAASPPAPENQDYFHVRLVDGRDAWVDRGDVDANPHTLTIPESIELAKRFLGVTYTWGGRSSFGFDCSGFTQMLVRSRGINMPRDADLQAAWSGVSSIDRKHLKPGDLLFFGASSSNITHTGMYIGKGKFIHDTTNGHPGVQISRLSDQPWTKLLVASRRVK